MTGFVSVFAFVFVSSGSCPVRVWFVSVFVFSSCLVRIWFWSVFVFGFVVGSRLIHRRFRVLVHDKLQGFISNRSNY